jgi:hypothetical protein
MHDDRNARIVDLKREIALLQRDERRLQWLISSVFTLPELKIQARADLIRLEKNLKRAADDLTRLEGES